MSSARRDLTAMLRPRSIALVGATDRSRWSQNTFDNLINRKYAGEIHLVSRRGGTVHGRSAATSCVAVGAPIDLALLMVPMAGDRGGVGRSRRCRCAQRGDPDLGFCRDRPRGRRSSGAAGGAGAPAQRIAARAELPGLRQLHRQRAAVDRRFSCTQQARLDRRRHAERRQRQLHLQPGGAARDRPVAHGLDRQRGRPRLRATSSII